MYNKICPLPTIKTIDFCSKTIECRHHPYYKAFIYYEWPLIFQANSNQSTQCRSLI